MNDNATWTLSASDGELLLHTGVTGTAARVGHRLTIAMRSWEATVFWQGDGDGAEPVKAELTIDVESLEVVGSEGGVTPLSGAEKTVVRNNALKLLRARRFPQARFVSSDIERVGDIVRMHGAFEFFGKVRDHVLEVRIADGVICGETVVRHGDYGIKQYSMLIGAMKVADEVRVTFTATHRAAHRVGRGRPRPP
ncbi:YceI family protein [Mycolicibacterium goodii]|uniref:S-adenosyl-L-methionine-dependent methyltransferase n=1 Tax=Mycolicibacterium goodii TaxID=134601 RepID=A0A0K0X358_MYCGD|nr:S-adenosyl-L-methionine-dependent methyltransferase [Mycolicibacterium goodii]